jgi:peptidoglycan-N-acetylglucosamine deacetylase
VASDIWWALPRLGRAGDGRAVGVLSVWVAWDHLLEWFWHPRTVRLDGVLRYRLAHHWGARLVLTDGTVVSRGDPVVELHFDNRGLLRSSAAPGWNPWSMMEAIGRDLAELASLVARGRLGPVRALHGVTMFATPGRRLGFEVRRVRHTWTWSLERYFLIGLLPIYHRDGWREFERMRRDRWPAELWMSVAQLIARRRLPALA